MENSKIEEIKKILKEKLGLPSNQIIDDNTNLVDDLKVDSLDQVELIMTLEDEFDLEISDEDGEKMKTFKDVVDYVDSKI